MDYLLNLSNNFQEYPSSCICVLNLIINGLPSKLTLKGTIYGVAKNEVLNLIINGLPSKQKLKIYVTTINLWEVLNLIINGLPSKPQISSQDKLPELDMCFKPYYKWTTF